MLSYIGFCLLNLLYVFYAICLLSSCLLHKHTHIFLKDALRAILTATKASNDLPSAGDDFDYYSTFQKFRAVLQKKRQAILSL